MRGGVRVGLGLVAWAALVVAGCTTGFELQTRPADVPTDRGVASDQGLDRGVTIDATVDAAPVDAPAPVCREPGDRCCADAMRGAFCTAGLVCSEGYCARCPGALFACGNACVDLQTSGRHCGACGAACVDGQRCVGGSCVADCPATATVCDNRCVNVQDDAQHCGGCGRPCAPTASNTTGRCRAGTCQVSCVAGFGDCDGNLANGCETDLGTTTAHCGGCGLACAPNRAAGRCVVGNCSVGSCSSGFADCDDNPTNGCEVDLARDRGHCGTCIRSCTTMQACEAGVCVASTCVPGTAECVPGAPACETSTNADPANCGACGRTCVFANAVAVCAAGVCRLDACSPRYFDCDGAAANGCERRVADDLMHCGACGRVCAVPNGTPLCRAGTCLVDACNPGFYDCDGVVANGCEVDGRTSLAHCGGCGQTCATPNATPACAAGLCGIVSCAAGYADCDATPSNGCEVATGTDAVNCGRCANVCAFPNAASSCALGACALGACAAGFGNCDGVVANGCEADTRASTSHCGACGRVCSFANASSSCAAGACVLGACAPGYADCDGAPANGCEIDTRSSGAHCGACGRACATGNICSNGVCVLACPPGQTACSGACVDLNASVSHCRACGNACAGGPNVVPVCNGGLCGQSCVPPFADCDGAAANGCESDSLVDRSNCGTCGRGCAAPPNSESVCRRGECSFACASGYADCDLNGANGCEAALQSDLNHCGRCGVACVPAPSERYHTLTSACVAGGCQFTCQRLSGDCNNDPSDGCEQSLLDSENCGGCGLTCRGVGVGLSSVACCGGDTTRVVCCGSRLPLDLCAQQGTLSVTCVAPR